MQSTNSHRNKAIHNTTVCVQEKVDHSSKKIKFWHLRLGHIPLNRLQIVFPELECKDFDKNFLCTICPLGKQTKKPFHKSSIKTTDSLQLFHIDL